MATNRKKPPEDRSCLSSCCGLSVVFGYQQKRKAQTAEENYDPEIMRSKYSDSMKAKHGKHESKPGQPGRGGTRHLDARRTGTKDSRELIGNQNNAVKSIHAIGKKKWVGIDDAATAVVAEPNPKATAPSIKELKDHKTGRSKAFQLTKEARHEDDETEFQRSLVIEIQEVKQEDTQKLQAVTAQDPWIQRETISKATVNGQISPNRMKTTWRPFPRKDEVRENRIKRPKKSTKASNSIIGVWVIVIMFATLILWGRLCSIFCFSALLYMIPALTRIQDNKVSAERKGQLHREVGTDSEEYKKKVIMKGILERQCKN